MGFYCTFRDRARPGTTFANISSASHDVAHPETMDEAHPKQEREGEIHMLYWALMFLVIAIVAGFLGFGAIQGTAATIAQVLFVLFLVFFIVSLVMGYRRPVV